MAEIHLGRLEEAEAALQQALAKDPENAEIIANSIVLNVIAGKDASELTRYVVSSPPDRGFHCVRYCDTFKFYDKISQFGHPTGSPYLIHLATECRR